MCGKTILGMQFLMKGARRFPDKGRLAAAFLAISWRRRSPYFTRRESLVQEHGGRTDATTSHHSPYSEVLLELMPGVGS